ncbi:hypothetical protein H072_10409 [Dactylellina haptotyla CBS 200.50]|uniref:Adhesin domain-containing protein n=1 Tax=Dactylellina haptotyla (strain CBS 200.50) TaxID=1284197 RepID=S8BLG8_DACHA|nr:hypothetical protein H072_10409 [Dactylellina haptotyla CBS 200.50]
MEGRDHPSMEEYLSSNPYITDAPTTMDDLTVADGYFGSRGPRLPVIQNPYITTTTETTADMTVTDGYFNGRPHQQLPVLRLANDEPVKTAMPEPQPNTNTTTQTDVDVEAQNPRPSQDSDSQTVYSRVSFGSERSTLPPSYTSRRVSYEEGERNDEGAAEADTRPLIVNECLCRHPQCISCVANGTAFRDRQQRCEWRRKLKCSRGCRSGQKKARKFKFCCLSIFFLVLTWGLFGGLVWKHAANRFKESMAYYNVAHCSELLPGTYEESFSVPLNNSLSSFSLQQLVVYEKQKNDLGGRINVDGYVNVEHAAEGDKIENDEVAVKVEYQVSDETILHDIDIRLTEDGVGIYTSGYTKNPTDGKEVCVFFRVTIKFPKLASTMEISKFLIDAEQLSVLLRPSLSLKVLEKAVLNTVTGNIWSKARQPAKIQDDEKKTANFGLQAKNLLISTTTGNIRGVWGLADSGSFDSKSGNIDIGLMSITSLPKMGPTTELSITTISGDIAIHSVSNDGTLHPFRKDLANYATVVKTVSGDIIGQYLLGSFLSVQTVSGDIEADILPISPAASGRDIDHRITVHTDTKSGRTKMSFLEATDSKVMTEPRSLLRHRAVQHVFKWIEDKKQKLWQLYQKHCDDHKSNHHDLKAGKADVSETATDVEPLYVDPQDLGLASLAFFKASHTTVSGEVFMHYPAAFEGKIKATTLTGNIDIGGENVQIIRKERNGAVGKVVEAVHGSESEGIVDSGSVSGDIRICVGDARW